MHFAGVCGDGGCGEEGESRRVVVVKCRSRWLCGRFGSVASMLFFRVELRHSILGFDRYKDDFGELLRYGSDGRIDSWCLEERRSGLRSGSVNINMRQWIGTDVGRSHQGGYGWDVKDIDAWYLQEGRDMGRVLVCSDPIVILPPLAQVKPMICFR